MINYLDLFKPTKIGTGLSINSNKKNGKFIINGWGHLKGFKILYNVILYIIISFIKII